MTRRSLYLSGLAGAVVLSFALSFVHPFGNPRSTGISGEKTELLEHSMIPSDASAVLRQKCADCHSNDTEYPWYGRFAPASWLLERDITEAREQMNLSQWESIADDQREMLKAKIVEEARNHDMPPPQYRLMHPDALVTEDEVKTLTAWAHGNSEPTASAAAETASVSRFFGDAVKGKEVFQARCTGCHSMQRSLEGPKLGGVFGRTSGTVPDFAYSEALKKAGIKWDEPSLYKC